MDVAAATASSMEGLVFAAGSQGLLGDSEVVVALSSSNLGGSDIGYSSTTSAECSVAMIARCSGTDDFTVNIPV